jgi:hypothetical protein
MSSKVYWLKFGSGDPRPNTGLTPTFLQFYDSTGQTYASPSITEVKFGGVTASGIYGFSYLIGQSTLNSIYFLAFSVTTVSSGTASDQYITGVLDPVLAVDQSILGVSLNLSNQGTTLLSLSSALGSTNTAYGLSFAAISSTLLGIGNSVASFVSFGSTFSAFSSLVIGSTASSFGTTSVDPSSVFGYLKRIQELLEGDQTFFAAGGTFMMFNRGALGSTTLLRTKTLLNSGAQVTKTGD